LKGTIVYLKTSSVSATFPEALKANASTEATSSKTIGAVFEDVLNDQTGYIVTSGEVDNLDTSAYSIGQRLWLSTTDGLVTTTPPIQPNHSVFIGIVTRSQNINGRILYAIQNGYELNELHDVLISGIPNDEEVLTFNGTTLVWENKPIPQSENIYNTDGSLTGNRIIDGNNFGIEFQNLDFYQINISNTGAVVLNDLVAYYINPTTLLISDRLFSITDTNASLRRFAVLKSGEIQFNQAYKFPLTDGSNGQVLSTNGSGVISWVDPSSEFIPKISGFNVSRFHTFTNGSPTVFYSGLLSGSIGGTQSALILSGATATKIIRSRFTSTTSSGSIAGYRGNGTDIVIGMGWHCIFTFGFADLTYNSSAHNWVGLGNAITFQIGSLTFASSLGNIIGIGNDPTDLNLQILHNDSAGSATKIDLGSNFPANRTVGSAFTGIYCLELFNELGSNSVKYRVTRIDTGAIATGILSTNLPSSFLCPVVSRCNGSSTSIAAIMDVATIQIYTKY
jgi:hypothetical protein